MIEAALNPELQRRTKAVGELQAAQDVLAALVQGVAMQPEQQDRIAALARSLNVHLQAAFAAYHASRAAAGCQGQA